MAVYPSLEHLRVERTRLLLTTCCIVLLLSTALFTRRKDAGPQTAIVSLSNKFPSLRETVEMAELSALIYKFRKRTNTSMVCDDVERYILHNTSDAIFPNQHVRCHWYFHDHKQGTQVMIMSSKPQSSETRSIRDSAQSRQPYIAIVFAGTDDLRTSLTDADIFTKVFGGNNDDGDTESNVHIPDPRVKVHAGFDNAVFHTYIFSNITLRVDQLLTELQEGGAAVNEQVRIFTTGHSLGAADSVLTAIGLDLYFRGGPNSTTTRIRKKPVHDGPKRREITSINFGCPHTGNSYWRDYVNENLVHVGSNVGIWRVVLGWDLVPRLPEFMYHVGHTLQLDISTSSATASDSVTALEAEPSTVSLPFDFPWKNTTSNTTISTKAYYHHYGDADLGYASVPFGWEAKPFIWVPGSLWSHSIHRYHSVLTDYFLCMTNLTAVDSHWNENGARGCRGITSEPWVSDFVLVGDNNQTSDDDDSRPPNVDDDTYVNPPDDDFRTSDRLRESGGLEGTQTT